LKKSEQNAEELPEPTQHTSEATYESSSLPKHGLQSGNVTVDLINGPFSIVTTQPHAPSASRSVYYARPGNPPTTAVKTGIPEEYPGEIQQGRPKLSGQEHVNPHPQLPAYANDQQVSHGGSLHRISDNLCFLDEMILPCDHIQSAPTLGKW